MFLTRGGVSLKPVSAGSPPWSQRRQSTCERTGDGDDLYGRPPTSVASCPFVLPIPSRRTPADMRLSTGRWTWSRGVGHA